MSSQLKPLAYLVTVSLLFAASVSADDLNPPPWRGGPGATSQEWDFPTPVPMGPPNPGFNNPFGAPSFGQFGAIYHPVDPTGSPRTGIWELIGPASGLRFDIPNMNDPLKSKKVWLQVTSLGNPVIDVTGFKGGVPFAFGLDAPPAIINLPGGWTHRTYQYSLSICPQRELISISGNTQTSVYIDQVVIDTICVPEPATLTLLGLPGLLMLRRRRSA